MSDPGSEETLNVKIWRGGADGSLVPYRVPIRPNQTVLDVVSWVQQHAASDLAYRFACRVGMCGSCAMMVNGVPRWTCRTRANDVVTAGTLEIRPLRNFPIIRDLLCDFTEFFERWGAASGRFVAPRPAASDFARVPMDAPDRRRASAAIECIGCGVCVAACDTVAANPDFLGSAALNRAWSAVNDRRDDQSAHLKAAAGTGGAHACHSQRGCVRYCPVGLDPAGSIAGLKRHLIAALLKGTL